MDVHVPKFGMSTQEVDIIRLCVAPGQHVDVGDIIAEIEGEKSSLEIRAERAGTVTEVLVREGDTILVGDVICRIDEGDAATQ